MSAEKEKKIKEEIYDILYPVVMDMEKRIEITEKLVKLGLELIEKYSFDESAIFPINKEIEEMYPKDKSSDFMDTINLGRREGAISMRDFIKNKLSQK